MAAEEDTKLSVVAKNSQEIAGTTKIVRFRGRPMVLVGENGFDHYRPLHREQFDRLAYPLLGGISRSRMGDVFSYLSNTADDMSGNDNLVLFGMTSINDEGVPTNGLPMVWDTEELTWSQIPPEFTVWRSPYAPAVPTRDADGKPLPVQFIMQLADGDQGVYDDIMQSIAPLIMSKKPDGVIWWVGDGANGKSTLMDALYRIFPGQLSSITVKRLVDGRDTPSLNGTLANIVKESSEGRIDDTEIYKSIGTHENFRVHKFHSQDDVEIRGNIHHIFSANSIPAFNDKGFSARRRTFIIPFKRRFESDPLFEQKTFTKETFGQLIQEMTRYAARIKQQGYKYKWSAATLAAKADYDSEANNAEEYVKEALQQGVVAFDTYRLVKIDYENWCADNGYVPLGIGNLKKVLSAVGFNRTSFRNAGNNPQNIYRLEHINETGLDALGMSRPGLYTTSGFVPQETADPEIPEMPPQNKESILKGKW